MIVNRIWQYHFGRGLAGTPSDFGRLGDPPSHPELLDWLAKEFVRQGWQLKPLHRLIVTSSAYRQSAQPAARDELAAAAAGGSGKPAALEAERSAARRRGDSRRDARRERRAQDVRSAGRALRAIKPGARSTRGSSATRRMSCWMPLMRPTATPRLLVATRRPTAPQALLLVNGEWALARAEAFAARLEQRAARARPVTQDRVVTGLTVWPLAAALSPKRLRRPSRSWADRRVRRERHPIEPMPRPTTLLSSTSAMCCLIQTSSSTLTRTGGMPSPEPGSRCSRTRSNSAAAQSSHRFRPSTRREWLLQAGAGFGGLALLDLLSRDLAAGPEPTKLVHRRQAPWRRSERRRGV